MPKQMITLRLEPKDLKFISSYAGAVNRTAFFEEMIQALRERRLVILSAPAPFEPNTGECPECPVMISKQEE